MRWSELGEENCPVARALSVVGDRWTLLVLREAFRRVRRFEAFQTRLGVTRPVLADRLRKLVEAGVLDKKPYQERPLRHEYRLTEKGRALNPVLMALLVWGDQHLRGADETPSMQLRHTTCGHVMRPAMVCPDCGESLTSHTVQMVADEAGSRDAG
jgi:DNA-binding HxlR family transcriptional regulator